MPCRNRSGLELQQARRRGEQQPAGFEFHFRHDRFHEGDQQLAAVRCGHLQQIVAAADQVAHRADGGAIGDEPCLQADQIEQVKLTLRQVRTIVRWHQQLLTHQGFGGTAVVDSVKTHHKDRLAGQLPSFLELDLRGVTTPIASQPPGPRWLRSNRGGDPAEIQLKKGRQLPGKSIFVVRFDGVDNRSAAEALVGQELLVPADDRPDLAEGEFHLLDLVGLEARLIADGPAIGTVSDLISGGNDLLEVTTTDGRKLLIPFVEAIVPEVKLEAGWLLLTPPPGLLEL